MIRRYVTALAVAAAVVTADLLTKRYAAIRFGGDPVDLLGGFIGFTYVENSGGAFGSFQGGGQIIGIAALVVTGVVIFALATPRPRGEIVALGLVIGGAVGNLVDRFARGDGIIDGPVIDWVNLWIIPTFNVADASVTVGVALLLLLAWWNR